MSITTFSLIESLLYADRPTAWWGLDTADPLTDDAVFGTTGTGYTLTAIGAPANTASLHTRGDTGASGARDFNGTTDGYFTAGTITDVPEGPPAFHASNSAFMTSATATVVTPGGIEEGDLLIVIAAHPTNTATVSTAPAGYTLIGTVRDCGTHARAAYRKTAVEADTVPQEVSVVWNSSAEVLIGMLVYRGCDPDVSNLVFDSAENVTSAGTFHSTSTETFPDQARQVVIWTEDAVGRLTPDENGITERLNIENFVFLGMRAVDYAEESAGSAFRTTTSDSSTTVGYVVITFGSPRKVMNDTLDTLAANLTIGCIASFDAFTSERTIVRKFQSWGLVASSAGVLQFIYRDGGGVDRSVNGPTLSITTNYRIWVVDDGTNIRFTVNGTTTSTARTGTAGYTTNTNRVSIAHAYNGSVTSAHMNGRIDELAVFSTAFTAQMVAAHETAATTGLFGEQITALKRTGVYPRGKLEIAVDSFPTAECHAFTDVTQDFRHGEGISTARQRNDPLDRMEAGTMSFALDNRARTYDTLAPRRVVRLRAQPAVDTAVQPIFFGYTEAPKFRRPGSGTDSVVLITATDAFKALSLNKVQDPLVRPDEYPHERIGAVLEDVPGLKRTIDDGVHKMIGDDLQGSTRLEHAQAIAESDGGVLFANALGHMVFQSNQHRSINEQAVRATYGWETTTATFQTARFEPEIDESRLYTSAVVTPASGEVQRADNDTAAANYFPLAKEITTLHALDADAEAMAHHIVNAYSVPLARVRSLELHPAAHSAPATMWAMVLSHDISHRIATIEDPPGGAEVQREHFVEGVAHRIDASGWTVTFSLSPTELEGEYFVIGTSQLNDSNAVIGW